jgi:hypothetical protein
MPNYYFDVHLGSNFLPNEHGLEFDGLDAAELEVSCAALELARHHLLNDHVHDVRVKVKNDDHREMLMVAVSMKRETTHHDRP